MEIVKMFQTHRLEHTYFICNLMPHNAARRSPKNISRDGPGVASSVQGPVWLSLQSLTRSWGLKAKISECNSA